MTKSRCIDLLCSSNLLEYKEITCFLRALHNKDIPIDNFNYLFEDKTVGDRAIWRFCRLIRSEDTEVTILMEESECWNYPELFTKFFNLIRDND